MTNLRFLMFYPLIVDYKYHVCYAGTKLALLAWTKWRWNQYRNQLAHQWDSVTNVLWKIPVPGTGYSSPIVWKDKLFLVTALLETQEKVLLCYDCKNGDLLWQKTVLKTPFEKKHDNNSYASGTPATDGTRFMYRFWMVRMLW